MHLPKDISQQAVRKEHEVQNDTDHLESIGVHRGAYCRKQELGSSIGSVVSMGWPRCGNEGHSTHEPFFRKVSSGLLRSRVCGVRS
jgi:hypothetical protein